MMLSPKEQIHENIKKSKNKYEREDGSGGVNAPKLTKGLIIFQKHQSQAGKNHAQANGQQHNPAQALVKMAGNGCW